MIYLLSDDGRQAMNAAASRPILYAFDYDGTLARISRDRGNVKLALTMHEWLRELSRCAPCAIVSGRALGDLTPRINGAVPYLIGNHGLESPLTADAVLSTAERVCLGWMEQMEKNLAGMFKEARVEVENKRYSLTFHARSDNDSSAIANAAAGLVQQLTPAGRVILGKASLNLLPPGSIGKGKAALALMAHLRCTGLFFIGDDETDEDVFELKEGLIMGVRVGLHPESKARFYVKYQNEVAEVLRYLVHRIDGKSDIAGQVLRKPGGTVRA